MSDNWYQQQLTPPEVVEVHIRLGLIPTTDHCQVLVEIKDPVTGILSGQASIPGGHIADHRHQLDWAVSKAVDWIQDSVEPF